MRTLILAAFLAAFSWPAQAQSICAPYKDSARSLQHKYGEAMIGRGMASGSNFLTELWANLETGTWTLLVLGPDGTSCVIGIGQDWQTFDPPIPGRDS